MSLKAISDQVFDLHIEGTLFMASSWFSDAIIVLTRAIELAKELKELTGSQEYHSEYIPILLTLSDCYMKGRLIEAGLNLLEEALNIEPTNIRAILTKSHYYSSVLNENEALHIINKGLKSVDQKLSHNFTFDPLYTSLLKERKRLMKNSVPSIRIKRACVRTTNLLKQLPVEIIVSIMTKLDQKSFINCLATCRDWRSTLLSIPELLGSFTLKRNLSLAVFHKYLNYIKDILPLNQIRISKLNIDCLKAEERVILKKLFASGLNIRKLDLVLHEVNNFELVRIAQLTQTKLFDGLNELILTLTLTTKGTKSIEGVIEMCTNLKRLTLNIRQLNERSFYDKDPVIVQEKVCSYLEYFSINNATELFLNRIFSHFKFPNLASFRLQNSAFNKSLMYLLLETPSSLECMDLKLNSDYPFIEILKDINKHKRKEEILKNFRVIKICYLVYQHILYSSGEILEPIHFPNLKTLELQKDRTPFLDLMNYLQKCKSIENFSLCDFSASIPTSFSLKLLLDTFPNLKNLKLISHTLRGEIVNILAKELMEMQSTKYLHELETNIKGIYEILRRGKKVKVDKFIAVIFPNSQQSLTDIEIRTLLLQNIIKREYKKYEVYATNW